MKILAGLLLILLLLVAGVFGFASAQSQHARVLEAQLALSAQRSATTSSTVLIVILLLIIGVLLAGIGGYVYLRYFPRQPRETRRWAPGPNAGFARVGADRAEIAANDTAALMQQMLQLQMLNMLREMQRPAAPNALPQHDNHMAVWYPPEG